MGIKYSAGCAATPSTSPYSWRREVGWGNCSFWATSTWSHPRLSSTLETPSLSPAARRSLGSFADSGKTAFVYNIIALSFVQSKSFCVNYRLHIYTVFFRINTASQNVGMDLSLVYLLWSWTEEQHSTTIAGTCLCQKMRRQASKRGSWSQCT